MKPAPRLLSSYVRCFILLDSRHYQRERWCVIRWNERLAVSSAPIPYRGLGIALRFTPNPIKGEMTSRLEPLICPLRVCFRRFKRVLLHPVNRLIYTILGLPEPIWCPLHTSSYQPGCSTFVGLDTSVGQRCANGIFSSSGHLDV